MYYWLRRRVPGFKYIAVLWGMIENVFFSVITAGWAPFVFILKQDKIYADKCSAPIVKESTVTDGNNGSVLQSRMDSNILPGQETAQSTGGNWSSLPMNSDSFNEVPSMMPIEIALVGCPDQDRIIHNVYVVSGLCSCLTVLIMGRFNQKYGVRLTRLVGVVLFEIGAVCVAFVSKENPWWLFLGICLITPAGQIIYITGNQLSYMFDTSAATVSGLLAGAMEGAAVVNLVIKAAHQNGIEMQTSYLCLFGLALSLIVTSFCFYPRDFIQPDRLFHDSFDKIYYQPLSTTIPDEDDVPTNKQQIKNSTEKSKVASSPFWKTLCSRDYLLFVYWVCVNQLIYLFFNGSLAPWLTYVTKGDKKQVSYYIDIVFSITLLSPLIAPSSSAIIDIIRKLIGTRLSEHNRAHVACAVPLAMETILGTILCVGVAASKPELTFFLSVVMVVFRAMLYSFWAAYMRVTYLTEVYAMLFSLSGVSAGLFALLQQPLFFWSQSYEGAWTDVFTALAILSASSLIHPLLLLKKGLTGCRRNVSRFIEVMS